MATQNRTPRLVWTAVGAVTLILAGVYWDISWHMSIGRDSFWTPAHLAIQAGGILAGLSGTYAILAMTVRRADGGVRVWGFRGPLGAFLSVWGASAMVVSAPFDNWWHAAYGLDVKILSPPHMVLTTGILAVAVGGVLTVLAALNRATEAGDEVQRTWLRRLLLVLGGEITVLLMIGILELTFRANLHRAESYRAMSIVVPVVVLGLGCASGHRFGATIVAAIYTGLMVLGVWIMPLVSAEPKLGPVYQHITHLIPLEFPPLIVVPAFALDLLRGRLTRWPSWAAALALGPVFVAVLVLAEWPFASFLQTAASENWMFGTHYLAYFIQPDWYDAKHLFIADPDFARGLIGAVIEAVLSSWLGLAVGHGLTKVRR